jgi:epoxyqueuosine reductase
MTNLPPDTLEGWIKQRSALLGFEACGISAAGFLEAEKEPLQKWLLEGMHGEMSYMERNLDKRLNPGLLLDNAKSVISFLYNYYPLEPLPPEDNFILSKYAYGRDYHLVIKEKLHLLVNEIKQKSGDFRFRVFTDSAPVMERAWASNSGLGWIGKNTCLIHPKLGSFFFLAEIITDLELQPDTAKVNDLCGGCTRCIDRCPTGAIVAPRVLDSRKCISYLTIEYRNQLPPELKDDFGEMIFGCDICQDVCPWNRFSKPHQEPQFAPGEDLKGMNKEKWSGLTEDEFDGMFRGSAVQRTGFRGLKRNIAFLASLLLILFLIFRGPVAGGPESHAFARIDTIPPPPPGNHIPLSGPLSACVGDTCIYFTETPVACGCQWMLDGVVQGPDSSPLEVVWEEQGLHVVILTFVCEGGQTSPPQALAVSVFDTPSVGLGPDTAIFQGQVLTLDAGNPGSHYIWSTGDTTRTIQVTQSGTYSVTVNNICGTGWDEIEVSVITGTAEHADLYDGKIYFDGNFIRLEPGSWEIDRVKAFYSNGCVYYDGPFIDLFHPTIKGLIIFVLFRNKDYTVRKVLVK